MFTGTHWLQDAGGAGMTVSIEAETQASVLLLGCLSIAEGPESAPVVLVSVLTLRVRCAAEWTFELVEFDRLLLVDDRGRRAWRVRSRASEEVLRRRSPLCLTISAAGRAGLLLLVPVSRPERQAIKTVHRALCVAWRGWRAPPHWPQRGLQVCALNLATWPQPVPTFVPLVASTPAGSRRRGRRQRPELRNSHAATLLGFQAGSAAGFAASALRD